MLNYIKHYILVILTLTTFLQSEEPLSIGFWNAENLFDLRMILIKMMMNFQSVEGKMSLKKFMI